MEKLLLLAVVVGAAAIVILMIYLIARVEKVETIAINGPQPKGSLAMINAEKPFFGLSGVDLWELLSGTPPPGYATADAMPLQPKYEHILYKHIETLFKTGMTDKKAGKTPEQPESPMQISTLRENVQAFMPSQYASVIYESGFEIVTEEGMVKDGDARLDIIDALDRTCEALFSKINLEPKGLMSSRLVPEATISASSSESTEDDDGNESASDDDYLAEETAKLEENLGREKSD
ncbi:MAG: hypothetical protein CMK30_06245 [Porticoccaceae bacterium]|nr:hypothetical protein [Porticoccaceae bacterium]|tara:strand:+ start:1042 stop:1746 length:705 start_codon:yes stop_codon:yes gene_type:complete